MPEDAPLALSPSEFFSHSLVGIFLPTICFKRIRGGAPSCGPLSNSKELKTLVPRLRAQAELRSLSFGQLFAMHTLKLIARFFVRKNKLSKVGTQKRSVSVQKDVLVCI